MASPQQVTQLLVAWSDGDQAARDELMPLVYEELRKLASAKLAQEKPGQSLQATALCTRLIYDWWAMGMAITSGTIVAISLP